MGEIQLERICEKITVNFIQNLRLASGINTGKEIIDKIFEYSERHSYYFN